MKNISKVISYILLLIIPFIIFFSSVQIKNAQGSYFQRNDYDPDYIYLINSLNLAQLKGYGVGNVDHPGTPVHAIGAMVILLKYNSGNKDLDMVSSVLFNPNEYTIAINRTLIFLISIALFFLGVVIFKLYGNIYMSLFFQLPFFISQMFTFHLTKVSADPFIMFIDLCLITAIFLYINKTDLSRGMQNLFIIIFSVLTGLGIAAKIIFIPVAIIPFMILKGGKQKLLYVVLSLIFFLFFVTPAFSSTNIAYFLYWIRKIVMHGGVYGTGNDEVLSYTTMSLNLQKMISNIPLFAAIYVLIFLSVFTGLFLKKKLNLTKDIHYRLLAGIFIAMTIQILMVAKHYGVNGERYLMPSFIFSLTGIYLCILIFSGLTKKNISKIFINCIYSAVIIILLSLGIYHVKLLVKSFSFLKKESNNFMEFVNNNYPDAVKIASYGATSQEWGMYYATINAGTQMPKYKSILKDSYPDYLFWGLPMDDCYTFEGSNNVNEIISSGKKVIFLCYFDDFLNRFINRMRNVLGKPNLTVEKKYFNSFSQESVYEVKLE